MIRQTLTLLGILVFLTSFFFVSSSAYATTPSDAPIDFTAMEQTCSIIQVYLNGHGHTSTCGKIRVKNSSEVIPLIGRDNGCQTPYDNMNIFNYNWTALLCFQGTGYMGVRIYQVNEVDDIPGSQTNSPYPDWFRAYPQSGGEYIGQNPGDTWRFGSTGVLVTQLCIGSSVGGHC